MRSGGNATPRTWTMSEPPRMKVQPRLSSGTIISEDFRTSVRMPIFETGYDEWPYATEGGTLLLVNFRRRLFGLTCRHVIGSFDWRQLRVAHAKFGRMFAPIRGLVYPSSPRGDAVDPTFSPSLRRVQEPRIHRDHRAQRQPGLSRDLEQAGRNGGTGCPFGKRMHALVHRHIRHFDLRDSGRGGSRPDDYTNVVTRLIREVV